MSNAEKQVGEVWEFSTQAKADGPVHFEVVTPDGSVRRVQATSKSGRHVGQYVIDAPGDYAVSAHTATEDIGSGSTVTAK